MSDDNLNLEDLQTRLEDAEKQAAEYKDGWQRTAADFENFKRRDDQMHAELLAFGEEQAVKVFLGVLEDLERLLLHLPAGGEELAQWRKGAEAVRKRIEESLAQLGIERIDTEGQVFNYDIHEAVGQIEGEAEHEGKIAQEIAPGYKRGNKVLKPAQVKVYKSK